MTALTENDLKDDIKRYKKISNKIVKIYINETYTDEQDEEQLRNAFNTVAIELSKLITDRQTQIEKIKYDEKKA